MDKNRNNPDTNNLQQAQQEILKILGIDKKDDGLHEKIKASQIPQDDRPNILKSQQTTSSLVSSNKETYNNKQLLKNSVTINPKGNTKSSHDQKEAKILLLFLVVLYGTKKTVDVIKQPKSQKNSNRNHNKENDNKSPLSLNNPIK